MTARPRILITGPAPPPPGGIASVIQTIVESELHERYDFVRFATSVERCDMSRRSVRLLNAALARSFGFDGAVNLESRAKLAAYARALEPRPDLAHIHTSHAYDFWLGTVMARMAQRRGIPALVHVHGLFDVIVPTWSRVKQAGFRRALRVPDKVIVLSEGWRRWFAGQMDPARIEVLRNPVDAQRFRPRSEAPRDGLVRLLFVGTNEPVRKGGYDILAAAPAVIAAAPQVRFVFVGEDTEHLEATRVRGTPLAPHFEFAGSKNAQQIAPYFENADVLLLPSYSEGLPIALLEGMAASLPVVACPVNGIPEAMSEPENGIFVAPGDSAALARAVLTLVGDPARRARIGAANRQKVLAEFDRSHYARGLGAIYERALAGTST
jgi:glycosyltransferase involved in cell wall biosynthesis